MNKEKLYELLENCFRCGESRGFENGKSSSAIYDFKDWEIDHENEIFELINDK